MRKIISFVLSLILILSIMPFKNIFVMSEEIGYTITFNKVENCCIYTYETQDYSNGKLYDGSTVYATNSDTGIPMMDGNDQVNFKVVLNEGYAIDAVTISPASNYKNLKVISETDSENIYRITKIKGNISVDVSVKQLAQGENESGKKIVFDYVEYDKSLLNIKTQPNSKITFVKGNNILDNRNVKFDLSDKLSATLNEDGSITLNGTGSGYIDVYGGHSSNNAYDTLFFEGSYTAPKIDKTGVKGNFNLYMCLQGEEKVKLSTRENNTIFEISREQSNKKLVGVWYWFENCTFENYTVFPVIVEGKRKDTIAYEPFCALEAFSDESGNYTSYIPFVPKTTVLTDSEETSATLFRPTIVFKEKYYKLGDALEFDANFLPNTARIDLFSNDDLIATNAESYKLSENELCSMITVKAIDNENETIIASSSFYFSNLPVVSIDVEGGQKVLTKNYYNATMEIVDSTSSETIYSGATEIKGRGNSTWSFDKKPYKLKLGASTNLFGMGKNKHWVLLANYLDESLMRNTIASNLATELGVISMQTVWVDLVVNGEYYGNYQLCEHIRIDKNRVPIHNWEDSAEDIAESVCAANGLSSKDEDGINELLETDFSWITNGQFEYNGQTYIVSDYYDIPDNILQGLLIEVSTEYDELSKFKTENQVPIMVNSPEYLYTNESIMNSLQQKVQLFENALYSGDGTVVVDGKKVSYVDFVEYDTLLNYTLVCLFMKNEIGNKSTYFYLDENSKMNFGPVWDFDYSTGSSSPWGTPSYYDWWVSTWFSKLIKNPNFVLDLREKYFSAREYLLSLCAEGGVIDQYYETLKFSGNVNSEKWFYVRGFEQDVVELKTWIEKRIKWIDYQFSTEALTFKSFNIKFAEGLDIKPDDSEIIDFETDANYCVFYKDTEFVVNANEIENVSVYINNEYVDSYKLEDTTASIKISKGKFDIEQTNVIQVRNADDFSQVYCTTVFVKGSGFEETELFNMVSGASIRLNEVNGMRFYATVNGDISNADEVGIIIAPKDMVGDNFTIEDKHVKVVYDVSKGFFDDNYVVGSIVNVKNENLARDFIARAYMIVDGSIYYAKDIAVQNLSNVADAYINDQNSGFMQLESHKKDLVEFWSKAND